MPQAPFYSHDDDTFHQAEPSAQGEEKPHFVEPPFTLIDERFPDKGESMFESASAEEAQQVKSPLSLRFLCFLGLIFCSIFGLGMVLMSVISTVMATLYLFRNTNLNQAVGHFWKLSTHTLIAGLGFTLGLISPTLGLGLIVLYFSVTGQVIDNQFLHSIIKRSFNKF